MVSRLRGKNENSKHKSFVMMKRAILFLFVCWGAVVNAQQFVSSGMIEFEVRVNNHKSFGDGIWGQMFKDKMPQFSTSYYQYTFNNDRSIYKFDRLDERTKLPWKNWITSEDNVWYSDYSSSTFSNYKSVFGEMYLMSDTLMKIEWKLSPNETREIAGFNCRKATGILFDSVYVFAFYTDEITVPGGPMGIQGLPGMILGITIPRMFTSWVATKVQVNGVNTNVVTPPSKGKKKKAADLLADVKRATSDWGSYGQQAIWQLFL
jgi:GLPGLI family protein